MGTPKPRSGDSDRQVSTDLLAQDPNAVMQYVRRTVARTCPASLAHKKEDLIQVVLLRVLEIHRQQGEIRSRSYLAQAAYSVLVDEMRRLMKKPETSLEAMEPDFLERGAAGRTPAPPDELRGLGDGIRACLEHLHEARRHAVTLHLQGFTAEEAQRTLGWGLKKVRNLTYRGMADLRACLHSKGFSDET